MSLAVVVLVLVGGVVLAFVPDSDPTIFFMAFNINKAAVLHYFQLVESLVRHCLIQIKTADAL